jgi:hypothetical protein
VHSDAVYFDATLDDDARRQVLFQGGLFVYSPVPGAVDLVQHARQMIEDAFDGLDPRTAQDHMPVEQYAALLADLKPAFIHHPRSKECIQQMLVELGVDPDRTYFDVPRLRTSTSDGYLTSGIAYAFHPHRDTWYSAPMCQQNWWLPVYDVREDNVLAFHPRYFDTGVPNTSEEYNYYEWNATSRKDAAKHIGSDTRKQPHALEPLEERPQIRLVTRPGGAIVFSAAQMHSSVPNTSGETRFSIDFRVVHLDDVVNRSGARNVDSRCTGTTMRDYLRIRDLEHVPEDLIQAYDDESAERWREHLVAPSA